jgi:hypothetical protein
MPDYSMKYADPYVFFGPEEAGAIRMQSENSVEKSLDPGEKRHRFNRNHQIYINRP